MRFGGGVLIDVGALPHAGRDKSQYRLSALVETTEDQSYEAALDAHLRHRLMAPVYLRLGKHQLWP